VAETCNSLAHTPFCVAEQISVKPYEHLVPGLWLGFSKNTQVLVRQHMSTDTASEEASYALSISTGPDFQSSWLTMEFLLTRAEIAAKSSLAINVELSSTVAGHLQFAVKSHGREIEPRFTEVVKYDIEEGVLQIADIASLGRSVVGLTEEFHDIRVLIFFPPLANANFTFSCLRLSLL
jgi:hypothetical protein